MQSKKSHKDYHYKYVSDAPIKVDTKKYGASLQWKFDYSFLLGSLAQFIHSEIIVEVGVSAGPAVKTSVTVPFKRRSPFKNMSIKSFSAFIWI